MVRSTNGHVEQGVELITWYGILTTRSFTVSGFGRELVMATGIGTDSKTIVRELVRGITDLLLNNSVDNGLRPCDSRAKRHESALQHLEPSLRSLSTC